MGLTQVNYEYLRNGWGHLELALVSGHRVCSAYVCYEARHKATLQSDSSKYEGGMLLLWGLKAMEEHDTGRGPMLSEGFSFLSANPLAALEIEGPVASAWWKDPAHPDRSRALSVAAQVFAEKIGTWTVETWRDRNYGKSETGANFLDDTRVVSGHLGNEVSQRSIADNLWHTLPSWSGVGVHPALVNAFARFGLAMWPRNDWMSRGKPLTAAAPAAPTATASNASVKIEWSGNATTHNVYRATNASGPWLAIALLRRGSSIADVAVQKGTTYYYAVSANTPTSESNLSSATSATP